ncbi:MAG: NosD domain-containing protein, partial [Candidatus Micrarchaeia archaeon]
CAPTECTHLSGCVGNDYYEYENVNNNCLGDCACSINSCELYVVSEYDSRCVECVDLNNEATFGGRINKINNTYYINDDVVLCSNEYHINPSFDFGFIASAIYINSSDIILNCNGAKIIGNGPSSSLYYGIYNNGFDNVSILNCEITNYSTNIQIKDAVSNVIGNNILYKRDGINLINSESSFIFNNTIWFANEGITLTNSSNNIISQNYLNGTGTFSASSYYGISVMWDSHYNIIDNNTVRYCWEGIRLVNIISNTNVTNNNLDYNWMHSLILSPSVNNILIENNTANNAEYFGMQIQCVNCTVRNNVANNISRYNGFIIVSSENSIFENITADNCEKQGILLSDSINNTIINSRACNNGEEAYVDIKESFYWLTSGINTFENLICDDSDPDPLSGGYCEISCSLRERPIKESSSSSSRSNKVEDVENEKNHAIRVPKKDDSNSMGNPFSNTPSQKIKP